MVRTKKVVKGSRASTRKRSAMSRCSTLSTATSVCDSDGFAIPAPVIPTLESLHRDLQDQFDSMLQEYDSRCKSQLKSIEQVFLRFRVRFISAHLKKPVVELLKDYQPPVSATKNMPHLQKTLVNSTVMQDRTNMQYTSKPVVSKTIPLTDKDLFKQPPKTRNSLRLQQRQKPQPTTATNKYVTPQNARPAMNPVTPKVDIDTPLSIIRRPRAGEFAMSKAGSPLMVSAIPRDEIPSVCVPLRDGTILSILPNSGISAEQLPYLDEDLRAQLETLQSNLRIITGNL